jgi:hypothetical protein
LYNEDKKKEIRMKFLKVLLMMALMFSAATSVYALDENDDAPCTAVATTGGDDTTPGTETATTTDDATTGQ